MIAHSKSWAAAGVCLILLIVASNRPARGESPTLAVIQAGVQRSEDAPFVPADFQFLPGEYLYFTFHMTGFASKLDEASGAKSFSLEYEVSARDEQGVALAQPANGKVSGELNSEDRNWTPKRRTSFLLPSYASAGKYHVHVEVKDLLGKTSAASDFPFELGGVQVKQADVIQAADFEFLRNEEDAAGLDIPAYAPGDTVWARFNMTGFKFEQGSHYRLAYGLHVLRPDGKPFLDEPNAAKISADSFYPAKFVPGALQITTPKDAAHGSYVLTLSVHDFVANQTFELKRTFTIE